MILTEDEAIQVIKDNLLIPQALIEKRSEHKQLRALVDGEDFLEELIVKIEHIEGTEKAEARKKYSRDIQDLFLRLFQPLDNIYYATGSNKVYNIPTQTIRTNFLNKIANIRDNSTLSQWVQNNAFYLMTVDPNGIIFLEYKNEDVYPTYKSINTLRFYKTKGQLLDYVLFEPKNQQQDEDRTWRIVDDVNDRTFIQKGESFILDEEKSYQHPFGQVPGIINSNRVKAGQDCKYSVIHELVGVLREFARDLSIKTVYKFLQGFPKHWRYVSTCKNCHGTGKTGDSKCSYCDGKGYMINSDVTDMVVLPAPTDKEQPVLAPHIGGFISPDLETWGKYTEEIDILEDIIYRTHWGTSYGLRDKTGDKGNKTATEIIYNKQPLENKLNKYADYAEFLEWKLGEWILNFVDPSKDKLKYLTVINLGRNYIIDSPDLVLERYNKAREEGTNTVVLDRLFNEYLTAKYRNNPTDLRVNLLKAEIEPYLHYSIEQVNDIFGNIEARKKILFKDWWESIGNNKTSKTSELLKTGFNTWFENQNNTSK